MADRFPSLEEFESGIQTDVKTEITPEIKSSSAEPTVQDFLARERAILGDDANQFATVEDAGLDEDLLGAGSSNVLFESKFPDISVPEGFTPVDTITGPTPGYSSGYAAFAEEEEEPEVIKNWREKRDAQNARRAEQFGQQRSETVQEAQKNIDDFYENYNSKKDKTIAQTRKEAGQFLDSREDTTSGGTSWERISKLVDVSGKGGKGGAAGSGKERFRELLMSLRKDDKAPGAMAY